jgi:hypothetical protein
VRNGEEWYSAYIGADFLVGGIEVGGFSLLFAALIV